MSDPKRATLITVGASKSGKNSVCKTVRLTINLDESNESKYPELNYKELVIAEDKKKRVENGKTNKLDPFSDNDEELERVAKKFEQKYGGKSTYGRKGRSKHDDFADIGMGYDENDPFIDNTDNYDEMMPPETDTFYGGFYINSGSLEFKSVPENRISDVENGRRNKRRISSSSSEEESSESSSDSESADEKETKTIANGQVHNDHRKKKSKEIDKKKKAKKIRRTDSSAATSGKQTSDDNAHGDAESADSRTSQSDSLTSKPAPSSENAVTSDSSRDAEAKSEMKLPQPVIQVLEQIESAVSRQLAEHPDTPTAQLAASNEKYLLSLEAALSSGGAVARVRRGAWGRAARALRSTRPALLRRLQATSKPAQDTTAKVPVSTIAQSTTTTTTATATATAAPTATANNKRKYSDETDEDISRLTAEEREAKIVDTLQRLKALIEDRTPAMMASYQAECDRVMEERKKVQIASDGRPVEKRLPKRRFPWCPRSRSLLARLKRLAGGHDAAAALLVRRALPLFPSGFVRMPTLLRQADLSKELKVSDVKRQRSGSQSAPTPAVAPTRVPATLPDPLPTTLPEPIQFPSSLTVTTSVKPIDKTEEPKSPSVFGSIMNSFSLSKDLIVEPEKKEPASEKKEEIIPNNIGSITITPVIQKEKKPSPPADKMKEPLLRVKTPAVLNEMAKKDKHKHKDKTQNVKEKRVDSPLHVDTSYQPNKKEPTPSPTLTKEELTKKQIENMRVTENNIPRPALVPVHHSPTFAKPDKRPPEVKKKKEIVIVSDLDPLGDVQQEPVVAVDDSSSDVEVIEDCKDKSVSEKCEVPSKDKVDNHKKDSKHKERVTGTENHRREKDDGLEDDIHTVMRNLREMEHSQETPKFNNSFGGVITTAKHEKSSKTSYNSRNTIFGDRSDKDKFAEPTSLNKMDGCSAVTG